METQFRRRPFPKVFSRPPGEQRVAKVFRHGDVSNEKYYFVDLGIPSRFRDDDDERLAIGRDGLDQDVPELKSKRLCDPFLVDVFIIGNLVKKEFVQVSDFVSIGSYTRETDTLMPLEIRLHVILPLVESMTETDPKKRPTASEVFEGFLDLIEKQSVSLRWRLRSPKESPRPRLLGDIGSVAWEAKYQIKRPFVRRPRSEYCNDAKSLTPKGFVTALGSTFLKPLNTKRIEA